MTTEEQATKLAEWLEQHPGSPAPEGIDREVLEAIYAIRPDLAPAPQVQLDTILGHITTGPFSTSADTQSNRRDSKPTRSRTIWAGFGSLAAAAAVLLIALPQQEDIGHIGPQLTPTISRSAEPDRLDRAIAKEAEEGPSLPVQAPEETLQTQKALPIPEPNQAAESAAEAAPPPAPATLEPVLDSMDLAMPAANQIGTVSGSSDSANFSAGALSAGSESPADLGGAQGYGTASSVSGSSTRASSEALAEPDAFEEDEIMEEEGADEPLRAIESNDSPAREAFGFLGRSGRRNERTRAAAPAAQMAEAAPAPKAETAAETEEKPASYLENLQSRAAPSDYQAPQFTASETLEPWQIQWNEAEKALQTLNASAYSEALQAASEALPLSSQNTPARAMLYWIQGQALIAMGQEDAAIDAFTKAIQLNAAR